MTFSPTEVNGSFANGFAQARSSPKRRIASYITKVVTFPGMNKDVLNQSVFLGASYYSCLLCLGFLPLFPIDSTLIFPMSVSMYHNFNII